MKKINFCTTQIVRIKNLLDVIDSDFFARVISRKIIVRIDDFIDITRRYNNSTITDGVLKRNLKTKLNELNGEFENLLRLQRHKFSAHIQDLEFGLRVDSWANITYENIIFFHDKIIEIYNLLEHQADFIVINNDLCLSSKEMKNIKAVVKDKDIESSFMMSTDILAMTRLNSSSMIPCHPIQDKVLTLNSIVIILDFEIALYQAFDDIQYKYILQTLIINDIISFIDNIITPENTDYTGLDELLEDKEILDNFLNTFNLDTLAEIRTIRNKVGSHIDRDDIFEDIISLLDNNNLENTLLTYQHFLNIFYKICNNTFYLKHLTLPPTKMNGVLGMSHQPDKTFFENSIITTEFIHNDINDINLYKNYLKKLFLLKDDSNYEDIRYFFYDALAHSEVVKIVKLDNKDLELKKAHKFFIDKLKSSITSDRKRIILKLLNDCSNGYPSQLTYILLDTYNTNKLTNLLKEYIVYLGNIGHDHSQSAMIMLVQFLNAKDFNVEYFTLLSLLKIDIKNRGSDCFNKNLVIVENEYSLIIKERLNKFSPLFKIFVSILLSSEMIFNPMLQTYHKFFKELYSEYFENISFDNLQLLDINFSDEEIQTIKDLKSTNQLSNIFIIIAEKLKNKEEAQFFYQAIVNNLLKLNFTHLPFVEHLAYSNYKIGDIDEAVKIYKRLVDKNPDIIEYRIQLGHYYLEQKDIVAYNAAISYIEINFNLNNEQQETLNKLRDES
ncbi:tetratricopeptide repeat protein [Sulfurimonas sp.]|uniref:tetratricopeptide repeat protein n=1 Tax=Sulfurimonas sp. TaxID=2022749 RepID=UPI002639C027|nr:tetratricopeptide repeat protein [Sulfurimonas sp.]MCW8895012.1 hypothetical protein [Sulfurimonas sp.]